MKDITIFLMLFLCSSISCSVSHNYDIVKYKQQEIDAFFTKYIVKKYQFYIPRGVYSVNKVETGETYLSEVCYVYNDSSCFFVSNSIERGTVSNIKNRFDVHILSISNNIDTLQGISINNKYWKEVFMNRIVLGYKNVPLNKKYLFDYAINSIVEK